MKFTILVLNLFFSILLAEKLLPATGTINENDSKFQKRDHIESFTYPLGPKIVCLDQTKVPCGLNNPIESSICCEEQQFCCINNINNYISCQPAGGVCCFDGHSCGAKEECCGVACRPADSTCCNGNSYCPSGTRCPLDGEDKCVPNSSAKIGLSLLLSSTIFLFLF